MGSNVSSDHDVFQDGHVGKESNILEGSGDAGLSHLVNGAGFVGLAVEFKPTGVRLVEAGNDIEKGGLACPIGANEAVDLPLLHL